jgi:hypothetical protein
VVELTLLMMREQIVPAPVAPYGFEQRTIRARALWSDSKQE